MVQTTHISNLNGMGTFAYAAPELLTGGKCNEVADIFSFGVLLWELVTGEMPRRGKLRDLRRALRPTSHELTDAHTHTPHTHPHHTHHIHPHPHLHYKAQRRTKAHLLRDLELVWELLYTGSDLLDTSDGMGCKKHAA